MLQLPDLPFYQFDAPLAIAHRGGDAAGAAKENSMAAFQSAWEAGITYGETDTVATRDGVALAIHGSRNRQEQGKTGLPVRSALEAMTYAEVRKRVAVGGEPIPTLEEVLTAFPNMYFFIDPKTWSSVQPLAELIIKLRIHERVSVGAFSFSRTKAVAVRVGKPGTPCLTIGMFGSLALLGGKLSLPVAKAYLRRTGATQFALPYSRVTPDMVKTSHALGMRLIVWTPNTSDDIARSFAMGVDGVMSDRTLLVRDLAKQYSDRLTTAPTT